MTIRLLSTFLIFEPEEVPSIPGKSTVIGTRKITEMCKKLDTLMEQNFSKSKHVTAEVPTEYISKPSYVVIFKSVPSNLAKPESRKNFLEQACDDVSSKIIELQCSQGDWKVIIPSKHDAHAIENALLSSSSTISAKVKSPSHFGIVIHVPNDLISDDVKSLVPNCSDAKHSGSTSLLAKI